MLYTLSGFIFGLFIPYFARRFAKFMPATPGYALYRIIRPIKKVSRAKRGQNRLYLKLAQKYAMRSIGWGISCGALSAAAYYCFNGHNIGWLLFLIWTLLLLYEIDKRTLLLPDMLTVPLLIGGFAYAAFGLPLFADAVLAPVQNSALGAVAGYVLPVAASLFMVAKHPEAFGGGDIKLLAALGAWLGLAAVPYLILLSCLIFGFSCLIQRKRDGAFGPAIVISALGLVFLGNWFMLML